MSVKSICLLCQSPLSQRRIESCKNASTINTLNELFNLSAGFNEKEEINKIKNDFSCSDCFIYLNEGQILLEDLLKIQKKLDELKGKIKDLIVINKRENSEKNSYLNSILNCSKSGGAIDRKRRKTAKKINYDDDDEENTFYAEKNNKKAPSDQETDFEDDKNEEKELADIKKVKIEVTQYSDEDEEDGDFNQFFPDIDIDEDDEEIPIKIEPETETALNSEEEGNVNKLTKTKKQIIKRPSLNQKFYQCEKCELKYTSNNEYKNHLSRIHGIKAFECTFEGCNEAFRARTSKTRHEQSAHKKLELKYFCEICSKGFYYNNVLKVHLKSHSGIIYECPESSCDKRYRSEYELKAHVAIHDPNYVPSMCEECGKSFLNDAKLRDHKKKIHGSLTFQCEFCPYVAKNQKLFQGHKIVHSEERNYMCHICAKGFKSKNTLRIHSLTHESSAQLRKFTCDEEGCNKSYKSPKGLRDHKLTHKPQNEWKYSCKHCEKKYNDRYKMEAHETLHGGEKKYFCDFPNCNTAKTHPYYINVHKHAAHRQKQQ